MATDAFKSVLYNDGEALTTGDLNDAQAFSEARLNDQILRGVVGSITHTVPGQQAEMEEAPYLYCLNSSGGAPGVSGALQLGGFVGGVIFQSLGGTILGDSPNLLASSATFPITTLAAGDATFDRIDVIEVKLDVITGDSQSRDFEDDTTELLSTQSFDKKKRVQATFNVKQGTPSASPAFPTLTTGYSALYAVWVPAGHSGVFVADTHFMDCRVPINVKSVDTLPAQMSSASGWALSGNGLEWTSSGAGTLNIPSPLGPQDRLIGVSVMAQQADGVSSDFSVASLTRAYSGTVVADVRVPMGWSSTSTSMIARQLTFSEIADVVVPATGIFPSGVKNAEGLGTPLWGNARPCGIASSTLNTSDTLSLVVTTTASGSIIRRVRWYYASGI